MKPSGCGLSLPAFPWFLQLFLTRALKSASYVPRGLEILRLMFTEWLLWFRTSEVTYSVFYHCHQVLGAITSLTRTTV